MKWKIFTIGKPKLSYARAGAEEYLERLGEAVEIISLKASHSEREALLMLEKSENAYRVALDEKGEQISSAQLAQKIQQWENQNIKTVALFIGGADGLSDMLKNECDWMWSLGKLTLQHELALVVALEQIYRAYAIQKNHPYHRE
ncbi:MAG: 23S rRNA (pseudouridine(1915)-N(3))-methyltransferase RlmH [Verrucomicrobiota bacterium]